MKKTCKTKNREDSSRNRNERGHCEKADVVNNSGQQQIEHPQVNVYSKRQLLGIRNSS